MPLPNFTKAKIGHPKCQEKPSSQVFKIFSVFPKKFQNFYIYPSKIFDDLFFIDHKIMVVLPEIYKCSCFNFLTSKLKKSKAKKAQVLQKSQEKAKISG